MLECDYELYTCKHCGHTDAYNLDEVIPRIHRGADGELCLWFHCKVCHEKTTVVYKFYKNV